MRLPDGIKGWLVSGALGLLALVASFLCGQIFEEVKPAFLANILPAVYRSSLASLAALFLLLSVILLCWIVYLHRRPQTENRFSGYHFDDTTGIAKEKKSGQRVCSRCLVEINQAVPLVYTGFEKELRCVRVGCKTEFYEKQG